jgi:hypothetical protein
MIFSTPTTPTRERLTRVEGASAWASRVGMRMVSGELAIDVKYAYPLPAARKLPEKLVRVPGRSSIYSRTL